MEYFHLTTPQQNIWSLQKYYENTTIANLCGAVFFKEKRDSRLLQQAIHQFIENQSGMRLRFFEDGNTRQYLSDETEADIPVLEFLSRDAFDQYAESFAQTPLELSGGSMYRFAVFHIEEKSGVLVVLSHLISDAWTFGLLANQLDQAYLKLAGQDNRELIKADYTDFIRTEDEYLTSDSYIKDKLYWEEEYAQSPERSMIKPHTLPPVSIRAERITSVLPLSLEEKLREFGRAYSVTPAVLFETAIIIYLSKINPENHSITIGIPVLNRKNVKEKNIAGMFISTMPLTVSADASMTALDLAKQITKGHRNLFRHQKYPFADILKFLREKKGFSESLYDVMVSYQNAKTHTGADTKWYSNGFSEVPLAIHIDNRDEHESHTINVDYQTAIFGAEEIRYLTERLEYILEQIVTVHSRTLGEIQIVPEQELNWLLYDLNNTYADYPRDKCVHKLFVEQAERTPDRIALVAIDKTLSYKELDISSNRVAHALIKKNIQIGDIIAFALSRKSYMIVIMLGILKSGAAYLPIDRDYPQERIDYILSNSRAKIYITENNYKEYTEFPNEENIYLSMNSHSPCYCIYTSGSTGKPKGTIMHHRGIVNLLSYKRLSFIVNEYIHIALMTTITFDVATQEIFTTLLNGCVGYLLDDKWKMSVSDLITLLQKNHIEMIFCTPSYLSTISKKKQDAINLLKTIKYILLAGERFYLNDTLKTALKNFPVVFENQYGPAETHVVTTAVINNFADITIGKPIANIQIYILDQNKSPVPIGVPGELYIAGDGVGLGYLNRPDLTAERFVSNPFATEENRHGKIMYQTGDLARWRTDGEIEYLGRIDTQVKIRGLRIELGEIEGAMSVFPGMQLTAASDKQDENGRQYLVGYYTAEAEINEKELRRFLSAKLPKYMIPNYFVHLDEMPITPSGKTDHRSLPEPDFTQQQREYAAPETETEKQLSGIWEELLEVPQIGKEDDFFELGGDSLLTISMLNEIETGFQVEISIRDIMEHTVLEQLARYIEQAPALRHITASHKEKYLLLPQQKAIYAACMKKPETLVYNMPAKLPLPEGIDRKKLRQSITRVLNSHRILKSCIKAEGNEIYGIYNEETQIIFEEYQDKEELSFVRPFNLEQAPLVRVGFTKEALLFDLHHIIADGDSLNRILGDIMSVYEGRPLYMPEIEYSDYADYFRHLNTSEHKVYFKKMLTCDFEPIQFPETQNPRQGGESRFYEIPEDVFLTVQAYARKNSMTDTMVFLAAYGILLSKYTGKREVLSSIILQNRVHAETKDLVGMFVNTLPFNLTVQGCIRDYMEQTKKLLLDLFRYQEFPFLDIVNTVGMDKSVINTSFVYQGDGEKVLTLNGQRLIPQFLETHTAKFDFSMELTPLDKGARMRLEYNCAKYDDTLMYRLAASYIQILEQLEKELLTDISVLPDEEVHKIIEEFNDTYVDYPRDKCVHELFFEQVKRTPDKIALVFEKKSFTYRELDEMSNSLAYFLREKGVKCGDSVAVLLKRDEKVIIIQLAVLKLGAVFIPVDSRYPKERIEYILSQSNAKILIKNKDNTMKFLKECEIEEWNALPVKTFESVQVSSTVPCYIIFTSGSTGQPKGCILSNRGLVNFCRNNNILEKCRELEEQICVSVNTISFDFFIAESLLPLLNGYTIVLANEAESVNQELFTRLVLQNGVNIIQTTPTRYRLYFSKKEDLSYTKQFKILVASGEALPLQLLKSFTEHTNAAIFNPLGPSECSVWAVGGELHIKENAITGTDITIGKPIANTQIYILDQDRNPVPVGVPGELHIAGDGVGLGYLNRPDLTAERFVPNPFATEENHHGKIMYQTGDLARWRTDGEIEYLDRIDTQVKIRGLRIELGEIEGAMAGFPEIQLTAVSDKKDKNDRQYLVGYYTAENTIDEKELRHFLSAKLPKYMVPNYFVHLDAMPMTPSGKMDRRNLPEPDFTLQEREYLAPETEEEQKLCTLLEELLSMEHIGIQEDFFELGGDSLTAMEYMAKAHSLGIDFSLQNVFDYPTVQTLCNFLKKGSAPKIQYNTSDFKQYQSLFMQNRIDETFKPEKKTLGNVLLTGATGFLGAHVLEQLMQEEAGNIYCLIRGKTEEACRKKLSEILRYYFGEKYQNEIGKRILPVMGDIADEGLAEHLPEDIQTVIHTAASVRHYGSYEYFRRVNAEGTRHVVGCAEAMGARLIHISTLSVSGNSLADNFSVYRSGEEQYFYETSLYIGQPLDNVYIHSKFEAERMVYDAMLRGLDAKVIRVGNLTNRASDYKFQPNYKENAFLTREKALLEFGLFPDYLMSLYSEFSPVDLTANGIVRIAQYADTQTVFHLYSNRPVYFERFLEIVHELGIPMKVVEGAAFTKALEQTILSPATEYIYEAFQNDLDENGRLLYDSRIHIVNDFTVWFLKQTGFEWNETDIEYLRGYIDYFRGIGYFRV